MEYHLIKPLPFDSHNGLRKVLDLDGTRVVVSVFHEGPEIIEISADSPELLQDIESRIDAVLALPSDEGPWAEVLKDQLEDIIRESWRVNSVNSQPALSIKCQPLV